MTPPERTIEVSDDPVVFMEEATAAGWGDGLPLIPPTPERVAGHVAAAGCPGDEIVLSVPPRFGVCTVESLAINAVMAGAPAPAMPLLVAALRAMAEPDLDLFALNTTTSAVQPFVLVNGPARHELDIPYGAGCFGGVAGPAPAIGRALRLVMRNIGGQVPGVTSQTVYGQPARVVGCVVAEWEERSPWAPFAERYAGVSGSAVTAYGHIGTLDIADIAASTGDELVAIVGSSLAVPGTNAFISHTGAQVLVSLAPPWADRIAAVHPSIESVQQALLDAASPSIDRFPEPHRRWLAERNRVTDDGRVPVVPRAEDVLVIVNGGLGNLHAMALHNFGPSYAVTRAI